MHQHSDNGDLIQVLRIDARPSDGLAVAVRQKCPIYVAEAVMDKAAKDVDIPDGEENEDGEGWGS